ncbi:MAG: TetR/AcrR family transcriptional regulator [Frankiales bacterium]|nr:TetR/AcrR family transcriptional regulator [Frankiales bacterium]
MRLRADAARNGALVLDAAREVFAEQGLSAGIDDVAARAGVGKATVYRCWPTKDALVAAVTSVRVDEFTARVVAARDEPDAPAAFARLMLDAAESCAGNKLLHEGLISETPALAAKRAQCRAAMQELIDGAIAAGGMRADLRSEDVTLLFNGATSQLKAAGETDPAVWRRYAGLVVAATRP